MNFTEVGMKRNLKRLNAIISYCKRRIAKANKGRYINFWCFVGWEAVEQKYPGGTHES